MSVTINVNGNVQSLVVNVSGQGASITANGDEVWSAGPSYPPYLTFSSADDFTIENGGITKYWDGALEYSTDAQNWTEWDGRSVMMSDDTDGTYYLYLRGYGNTLITGVNNTACLKITGAFTDTYVSCTGNLMTLLDYTDPENAVPANNAFMRLFNGNKALIEGPSLISNYCSQAMCGLMYNGCVNLETITALPATSLDKNCYNQMYKGCTKIKLSETQTGEYQTPFRVPTTGAGTELSTGALSNMFADTGGTFTGTPTINTTYYTSNRIV